MNDASFRLPAAPQPQWRREEWMRGWQQSSGPDFPPPPPGEASAAAGEAGSILGTFPELSL